MKISVNIKIGKNLKLVFSLERAFGKNIYVYKSRLNTKIVQIHSLQWHQVNIKAILHWKHLFTDWRILAKSKCLVGFKSSIKILPLFYSPWYYFDTLFQ